MNISTNKLLMRVRFMFENNACLFDVEQRLMYISTNKLLMRVRFMFENNACLFYVWKMSLCVICFCVSWRVCIIVNANIQQGSCCTCCLLTAFTHVAFLGTTAHLQVAHESHPLFLKLLLQTPSGLRQLPVMCVEAFQ